MVKTHDLTYKEIEDMIKKVTHRINSKMCHVIYRRSMHILVLIRKRIGFYCCHEKSD